MLEALQSYLVTPSVSQSLLVLTVVVAAGLYLGGRLSFRGMSIGVTWILFCGLLVSALGLHIHPVVEQFARDFGLVLFVYSLGLQAGPSFFASFSKGGVKLNMLAVAIIVLGVACTLGLTWLSGEEPATMVGVMAGAVTNTPSMGAAQQAYSDIFHTQNPNIAAGYALAYPFSIIGVIASMLVLRRLLRLKLDDEQQRLLADKTQNAKEPVCVDVRLFEGVEGLSIRQLHKLCPIDMIVSRIIRADGSEQVADSTSVLAEGDTIRVLTDRTHISALEAIGRTSVFSRVPKGDSANLVSRRIVVTKSEWNGQKIGKVAIRGHYHVNITRVIRAGVNLLATPDLTLQLGDRLIVVGEQEDVRRVAELFGNELRRLDTPHLVPVFLGMALGVIMGTIPIVIPGSGQTFRFGLAGGTLIVALLMGRFGPAYRVVTFVTTSANRMLREVGLALFLASVGLGAGSAFLPALVSGGYMWILYGLIITMLPLLIAGWAAYRLLHIDFFTVTGLFTGACNDAPALAYAMSLAPDNDRASLAFATVYPLTMFLRILAAQLMIVFLC
ncbi:MAG: putative transporter [Paludibacteraceae bacterium]|nr:putative transporter [Paludibacteraceae bacterium]